MDLILDTTIEIVNAKLPLYVYSDTHYKDSITGKLCEDFTFTIPIHKDYCLLVSLESIKNTVVEGYKQNSVVSPQDCPVCEKKFQFAHSCMAYNISSDQFAGSFPSTRSSSSQSNMTQPAKNMSTAISKSTTSGNPLVHVLFDTTNVLVCKECISSIFSRLEEVRTDPDLLARSM